MRSVIILEEPASAAEPDVDDPWEYVEWEEDDPDGGLRALSKAPSFAEVLTRNV